MSQPTKLVPYDLSGPKKALLERCFSQPASGEFLEMYTRRPRPSKLRERLHGDLAIKGLSPDDRHSDLMLDHVYRSITRSWDDYTEGSVAPNEFMRTPFGVNYEIVSDIPGKGRGIVASRDIEADETILQDSPVYVAPTTATTAMMFLLPQKALEAILLLHDEINNNRFTAKEDTPKHRLLDHLGGTKSTNSFGVNLDRDPGHVAGLGGEYTVLLLRGSLFNHSDQANVDRHWDEEKHLYTFTSQRMIRAGEELVINYIDVPWIRAVDRREKLKKYGIF